jgi:GMP synthase (glutamine-hydrolysing)
MKKTVTVVQHVAYEGLGYFAGALAACDLRWVKPTDAVPPLACDALIVLGGPMAVSTGFSRLSDELKLIEAALSKQVPIFGICLGSQLLASVLGAKVSESSSPELGLGIVSRTQADPLFDVLPQQFTTLHWHHDVFALPSTARSLASSEHTQHQAFVYGNNAYGALFHLEVTPQQAKDMSRECEEEVRALGSTPEALVAALSEHEPTARELADRVFKRFVLLHL